MWDCIIVGAGPAGLTAATYLGRFRRSVLVLDDGNSRLKRIPLSRNVPGFPDGVSGEELHERLRHQAEQYGAVLRVASVEAINAHDGGFEVIAPGLRERARRVLMATGVEMNEPSIPNIDDAMRRGLIRYCPICDAFEAMDQRIAVVGARPGAISEAQFLRSYSDRVTFLWREGADPDPEERQDALRAGIKIGAAAVQGIAIDEEVHVTLSTGERLTFDVLYPSYGCHPRSELARALGADVSTESGVIVDKHQRTTVPGLFAAGDVLQGLDQIASACGQAAIAATAIHNELREADSER